MDSIVRPSEPSLIAACSFRQSDANRSPPTDSLANREIYKEFCKFWLSTAILAPNRLANSIGYGQIPYATEQGISFRGTGKSW
jgi:hypothetical protein